MSNPISIVKNCDCMIGMKEFPDKFFELAVVDPPYGIGLDYTDRFGDTKNENRKRKYVIKQWNESIPNEIYFNELYRVSKHQIIWGCNFYNEFIKTSGRIIWDKQNDNTERWSHCDIASCSKQNKNTIFRFTWDGFRQGYVGSKETRFHPTQKPIALYTWTFRNYAKPGDKIIDTHMGSQSSRIAAYKMGFDYWGYELDAEYFKAGCERFNKAIEMPLFDTPIIKQEKLF